MDGPNLIQLNHLLTTEEMATSIITKMVREFFNTYALLDPQIVQVYLLLFFLAPLSFISLSLSRSKSLPKIHFLSETAKELRHLWADVKSLKVYLYDRTERQNTRGIHAVVYWMIFLCPDNGFSAASVHGMFLTPWIFDY